MDRMDLLVQMSKKNEENLSKIEAKIDQLDSRLDNVDVTLVKQEAQLAEHIRRTNLLEASLQPVEDHVKYMNGALKLITVTSTVGGFMLLVLKLFGKI